ncbi:Bifunctional purine biosynthesis protein PurH, partial [Clarias magur]
SRLKSPSDAWIARLRINKVDSVRLLPDRSGVESKHGCGSDGVWRSCLVRTPSTDDVTLQAG